MTVTTEHVARTGRQPATRPGLAERLARWSIRHRGKAIGLWLLLVLVAVVAGGSTGTKMLADSQTGAGDSARAEAVLDAAGYPADVTERILIQAPAGTELDSAAARSVAEDLTDRLGGMPEIAAVGRLVFSADGRSALAPVEIDVDDETGSAAYETAAERVPAVLDATAEVAKDHSQLSVRQVGGASLDEAIGELVGDDFRKAELLSLPVTLGILLLTFGALLAAGVPVLLAITAVATAIGLSALVSQVAPTSDTLNSLILLIGMAVGVDYSLFYVRRAREEHARGASRRDAIDIAARTSGHAVVVSGIAVMVSMAGLLLAGNRVFSSMAAGTMLVVAVAVVGSLTVLPAFLSLLGEKIERPRVPLVWRLQRRIGGGWFWPKVMRVVLARPLVSLLVGVLALGGLALPAFGMKLGETGVSSLPTSVPEVRTHHAMTEAFPSTGFAHTVVLWSADGQPLPEDDVARGVAEMVADAQATGRFADLGDVTAELAPDGRTAMVDLPMLGDFNSDAARDGLALVREQLLPDLRERLPSLEASVTGPAAESEDFKDSLKSHLPLVFAFVLAVTFVVLVVAFRSVVVAVTAVALNLLSVGAAYGLIVLVFQHGVGAELIGAESTGFIVDWLPLFLFVILFGLSMDYHVFVVSRIREAHQRGLPTRAAISAGVTASAGVVTSAAAVMVGVFSIFGVLSLVEFKQIGVGLAAAVLIDATVVRALLLPAAMAILGRANWWLPDWLDRRLPAAH